MPLACADIILEPAATIAFGSTASCVSSSGEGHSVIKPESRLTPYMV
jgi:hypothetical protein